MDPTIFMVWLSSSETDGGWWTEQAREERDHRDWSKAAPLHLSFHTSEEAARAALGRVCHAEWDRSNLAYAHGPWGSGGDSTDRMIAYMRRHCGYEAHVTEQRVALDAPEEPAPGLDQGGYGDSYGPAITTGTTATVAAQLRVTEDGARLARINRAIQGRIG